MDLEVGGISELVLESAQPERMVSFYEALGLRLLLREGQRTWLAAGRHSRLGIWPPGEQEHGDRGGRHVHFALSVDKCTLAELARKLERRGEAVEGPLSHPGGDESIYLSDPEGNRVELWSFFSEGQGERSGVDQLAREADAGPA